MFFRKEDIPKVQPSQQTTTEEVSATPPKPICSAYEALSDSDSEDADKQSQFSQPLAEGL